MSTPTPDQARGVVALDRMLANILENGVPLTDQNGNAVLDADGNPIMRPPPAAYLNVADRRYARLGITTDPKVKGSPASDFRERFEEARRRNFRLAGTGTDGLPPISEEDDEATRE